MRRSVFFNPATVPDVPSEMRDGGGGRICALSDNADPPQNPRRGDSTFVQVVVARFRSFPKASLSQSFTVPNYQVQSNQAHGQPWAKGVTMVIQQWAQRKPNRPTAGSRLPRHPPPPPTVDPGPRGPWTRSVRPGLVFSAGPGPDPTGYQEPARPLRKSRVPGKEDKPRGRLSRRV